MNENNNPIDPLLIRHLLQETTAAEAAEVEGWLAADDANRAYFETLQTLWANTKPTTASSPDVEAAWQVFQNRIHNARRVRVSVPIGWLRVAALFILLAGAGWAGYFFLAAKPAPLLTAQSTTVVTTDTLSDGSVVTLNKKSTLTYPQTFTGAARAVALQGEAFFNITPNKQKPFVITADGVTITVVGTSFGVRSRSGVTEVVVHTGVVRVTKGAASAQLRPNEKLVVQAQDSVLKVEHEPDQLYRYYQDKQFVCDHTPLWKLVTVLNQAYDAHIVIENATLRNLPLTATFPNESLDRILAIIGLTFNIEVQKKDTAIILK